MSKNATGRISTYHFSLIIAGETAIACQITQTIRVQNNAGIWTCLGPNGLANAPTIEEAITLYIAIAWRKETLRITSAETEKTQDR